MKTTHKLIFGDSRDINQIKNESIDLMVTSPPYPMIEMWDEIFSQQNPKIKGALEKKNGELAFEEMHKELDKVWKEVYRTLKFGGIACINIGDATRTINNCFKLYPNHARVLSYCNSLGFDVLPEILWRKQSNKPNKFMGSGMLPVGAYVTLEHEHILILRKGSKREFKTKEEKLRRQMSSFFWEERNMWFSDMWNDVKGDKQNLSSEDTRSRSASYPFELVYRLINMFSVQGDTVLDPFLGTGTTTLGAITSGRNSIGIEIDNGFNKIIKARVSELIPFSNEYQKKRINRHLEFAKNRKDKLAEFGELGYDNDIHSFSVMTKQEVNLKLPNLISINKKEANKEFEAIYD